VEGPAPRGAPGVPDVQQHREADGAEEGADHDGQAHPPVADVGHQALLQHHEAGVVEDGQRHEHAVPDRGTERLPEGEEPGNEDEGEDALDHHGGGDDGPDQGADLPELGLGLGGGQHALREADVAGDREGEDRGDRHDAQAADGDAHEDHRLAERGPVGGGVHGHEPGDAHGGGGGEERVGEGGALPRGGGDRQGEECGDHRDDGGEDEEGEPGGGAFGDLVDPVAQLLQEGLGFHRPPPLLIGAPRRAGLQSTQPDGAHRLMRAVRSRASGSAPPPPGDPGGSRRGPVP